MPYGYFKDENLGRVLGSQIYVYNSPDEIPSEPGLGKNDVFIDINLGKLYQWDGTEWIFKFDVPNDSRIADVVEELTTLGASLRDAESARVVAENGRATAEQSRATAETARESAESTRKANETARQNAESERASAETSRSDAESLREEAEDARQTAEGNRAIAERARAEAEANRASAESSRATAESGRVSSEQSRAIAEQSRVTAEGQRATAETARANAEGARASAETARQTNESTRQSQEQARQGQESARQTAEGQRASAETARNQNEANRQIQESNRQDNEGLRVQAENTRAANDATWNEHEQTRQENEAQRVLAEQARVEAETRRQAELDSKITFGSNWYDGSGGVANADNADQLNSPDVTVDQAPYLYRTSGGDADIGNREKDTIVGGSLGWNQLQSDGNFETAWIVQNGSGSVSNNVMTFTATVQAGQIVRGIALTAGHKYLSCIDILTDAPANTIYFLGGCNNVIASNIASSSWQTIAKVWDSAQAGYSVYAYNVLRDNRSSDWTEIKIRNAMVIDLTACFGPTIADYIYGLEQATAGAGVAWFRKLFPKPYYPYKAIGGFLHVKLTSHDMVGFNAWDEEYVIISGTYLQNKNAIRVMPSATYYFKIGSSRFGTVRAVDKNNNAIRSLTYNFANGTLTIPNDVEYIGFTLDRGYGITYKGDICINLSWSGWRNGQYEAYKKNSYPLDTSVILRGIPKLDADNNLYYDGDRYEYTGKVTRKYGIVDLGTLNWEYANYDGTSVLYASLPTVAINTVKGVCSKYPKAYNRVTGDVKNNADKTFCFNPVYAYVNIRDDSYTDAATFKTAMSGVYLVYELAEPIEETATPFQETQEVDDFGTEEYVVPEQDGVSVPVGHYTEYPENLRDKLRRLPNMPTVSESTTATYAVNYNGQTKKCSFVPINDWLAANGYPTGDALKEVLASKEALGGTLRNLLVANTNGLNLEDTDYIDMGDMNWGYSSGRLYSTSLVGRIQPTASDADVGIAISTNYAVKSYNTYTSMQFAVGDNGYIYLKHPDYTDSDAFKSYVKGQLLAFKKITA